MLVRFLSYAASVIGARRYKPLLISCLAVIFSITGITIIASSISDNSKDQASRISEDAGVQATVQQSTTGTLDGLEKKQTKDDDSSSVIPNPSDTGAQSGNGTNPNPGNADGSNGTAGATSLEITINSNTISLSGSSAEAAVTVASSTTETNMLQWTITAAENNGSASNAPTARIEPSKDATSAVIRFRSDNSNAGTYRFTIVAKDAARQLNASKTVTVVVN